MYKKQTSTSRPSKLVYCFPKIREILESFDHLIRPPLEASEFVPISQLSRDVKKTRNFRHN